MTEKKPSEKKPIISIAISLLAGIGWVTPKDL